MLPAMFKRIIIIYMFKELNNIKKAMIYNFNFLNVNYYYGLLKIKLSLLAKINNFKKAQLNIMEKLKFKLKKVIKGITCIICNKYNY